MGRLTERCENETLLKRIGLASCSYICKEIDGISYTCNECPVGEAFNKLAHYEDMEEQGRLIELPCAVGDTIYEIHDGEIRTNRLVTKWRIARYLEEGFFGELVFTTKEEAEAKLKELEGVKE